MRMGEWVAMSSWEPSCTSQQRQLPGGGEGGFWFVQQVQPLAPEPVVHQAEEALPVGLMVEGFAAVALV